MTSRTPRVDALLALRGIAAARVAAVHAVYMFPLGVPDLLFTLVQGIPLFFILSAFSLSAAYSSGMGNKAMLARYAIRRLFVIVRPIP